MNVDFTRPIEVVDHKGEVYEGSDRGAFRFEDYTRLVVYWNGVRDMVLFARPDGSTTHSLHTVRNKPQTKYVRIYRDLTGKLVAGADIHDSYEAAEEFEKRNPGNIWTLHKIVPVEV